MTVENLLHLNICMLDKFYLNIQNIMQKSSMICLLVNIFQNSPSDLANCETSVPIIEQSSQESSVETAPTRASASTTGRTFYLQLEDECIFGTLILVGEFTLHMYLRLNIFFSVEKKFLELRKHSI